MDGSMHGFLDMDIYKLAAYIYITHMAKPSTRNTHGSTQASSSGVDTASACEEKGSTS
jgi:hypothetical protein